MSVRKRVHAVLEGPEEAGLSQAFDRAMATLIFLNVVAVALETVKAVHDPYQHLLHAFDLASVAVFSVEYALRVWACVEDPRYARPVRGRLRFALSPLALIDLVAIVPFYMPVVFPFDLRELRLVRLLRFMKMSRHSRAMRTVIAVLRRKREELASAVTIVSVLLVVVSSLMYFIEHEAQPEVFSSIPSAMWWGVTALSTIGYGDALPITTLGKFFGGIVALLGVGLFALPAGILASGFSEEVARRRSGRGDICPYCGGPLPHEPDEPRAARATRRERERERVGA